MKRTLTHSLLLCGLIFLFIGISTSQAQKKNTTVTMVVNTAQINESNKNQMVKLYDSDGNSSTGGNHTDFLSMIDTKKFVFWYAQVEDVAGNPADRVSVIKMEMKEQTDNKQLLTSKRFSSGNKNYVRGKVKSKYLEGDEYYNITFAVTRSGNTTEYTIDPKLRIRKVGSADD